jgi:hypothetical protein
MTDVQWTTLTDLIWQAVDWAEFVPSILELSNEEHDEINSLRVQIEAALNAIMQTEGAR